VNLVTGATGFIGRHLAARLVREAFPLRVLCRPGSEAKLSPEVKAHAEIARGDLRDRDSLFAAARGATRVFHCAALVADWGESAAFASANAEGTRSLTDAAIAAGVARFVHLSSIAVFGTPSPPDFDDSTPYGHSADDYSRSKAEGEKAVFEAHRARGLAATVLRPAVVYGPGGPWLEEPLAMIEQGRMFLLGGGEGTCHPCYVENLVDAMLLAGNHPAAVGEGFIVADGEPITFREYFDALASIAGKPPIARSIPLFAARAMATALETAARVRGRNRRPLLTHTAIAMVTTKSRLSTQKIRRVLGWRPRWSFHSAISDLRAWYSARDLNPV
jgi:nucleoside-diphosphate-sugar epimerase